MSHVGRASSADPQYSYRASKHLVAVLLVGQGIVLEVIRYSDELRDAGRYFAGLDKVKYDEELLELASQLEVARPSRSSPSISRTAMRSNFAPCCRRRPRGRGLRSHRPRL
jgi:non-homologous end joining protein Ku